MYENCESEIKSNAPRNTHFSTFRVEVTVVEEVTSQQVLEVRAGSRQQAERIAEEDSGSWRNGESSRRVKIIEPEHIVHAETLSFDYEVEGWESRAIDRMRKLRLAVAKLGCELMEGQIRAATGKILSLPIELRREIEQFANAPASGINKMALALVGYAHTFSCPMFEDIDDSPSAKAIG